MIIKMGRDVICCDEITMMVLNWKENMGIKIWEYRRTKECNIFLEDQLQKWANISMYNNFLELFKFQVSLKGTNTAWNWIMQWISLSMCISNLFVGVIISSHRSHAYT